MGISLRTMIRRDICLCLALVTLGGTIYWITRTDPAAGDTTEAPDPSTQRSPVKVGPIKSEKSLLLANAADRGDEQTVGWSRAFERMAPSLVTVLSYQENRAPDGLPLTETGVFVSTEGHLLCPYSLVPRALALRVRLADGTVEAARVLAVDPVLGMALLQISRSGTPSVSWPEQSQAIVADRILLAGRSSSGGEWFTTALLAGPNASTGSVDPARALDRIVLVESPAVLAKGAVAMDIKGQVVGWVRLEEGTGSSGTNGPRCLLVPAGLVAGVLDELMEKGRTSHAQLGATVQALDRDVALSLGLEKIAGVLVSDVLPGQAAESAGIQAGDVILSASGFTLSRPVDLRVILSKMPLDQAIPFEVWQQGGVKTLLVTPATPQPPFSSDAGTVDPFPGDSILKSLTLRSRPDGGMEVDAFKPEQVVASASLLPGDRILEVEGQFPETLEAFAPIVEATKGKNLVRLRIESAGVRRYLTLKRL